MNILTHIVNKDAIFEPFEETLSPILSLEELNFQKPLAWKLYFGHFDFDNIISKSFKEYKKIILIRDPRDNVISRVYYFGDFKIPENTAQKFFSKEKNLDVKISAAIFGKYYHDGIIHSVFDAYNNFAIKWNDDKSLFIRYEDLLFYEPKKQKTAIESVRSILKFIDYNYQNIVLEDNLMSGADPIKSLTYRSGKEGNWKNEFSNHHIDEIKLVSQGLISALGYEKDDEWNLNDSSDKINRINFDKLGKIDQVKLHHDFEKYIQNTTDEKLLHLAKSWFVKKSIDCGNFEAVNKFIDDVIAFEDDSMWIYYKAFSLHNLKRESKIALENYEKALQLGFSEFWIRYNRGQLFMELGMKDEAIQDLRIAKKLNPDLKVLETLLNNIDGK